MKAFLSIIIPIYNVEKWIERCIKSVLSQSFNQWELILVNDGSTDNSGSIAKYFAKIDSRIHYVDSKNYGVSHARNLGLKYATGKYISFIDSDDELEKNAFGAFVRIETVHKVCLYKLGYRRISVLGDTKIVSAQIGVFNVSQAFVIIENNGYSGFLWNSIFKKDIIEQHQLLFDESISWCEDHLFFLKYLSYCKSVYIDNSFYYRYYIGDNIFSLSSINHNPYVYLDIAKREYYLKSICNRENMEALTLMNQRGFNEKCILAVRSALLQGWNLKKLHKLYKDIRQSSFFTNNIYFFKNEIIFLGYCLGKKLHKK